MQSQITTEGFNGHVGVKGKQSGQKLISIFAENGKIWTNNDKL